MRISILAMAIGLCLAAPVTAKSKSGVTMKVNPPKLWAARMRDTVWIGWATPNLGSPENGWKLEGKTSKGWMPVYPGHKPVYITQDTAEIAEPLCPADFVAKSRQAVSDPRGGMHRSKKTLTNAKLREELSQVPEPMRDVAQGFVAAATAQDAYVAVALGAGAMVVDREQTWSAFRAVPSKKGKALESVVVKPNLRVDSIREVRMVPDRSGMGISMGDVMSGDTKATLESHTAVPDAHTLYYKAWSNASNLPGIEMSLWVRDSSGQWERLRHMGTTTPLEGRDTQMQLDAEESQKIRKATAIGFGYAVLARLDIHRVEVLSVDVEWEKP